jgi:hypothetical protein
MAALRGAQHRPVTRTGAIPIVRNPGGTCVARVARTMLVAEPAGWWASLEARMGFRHIEARAGAPRIVELMEVAPLSAYR